jgi:cation:H+ antiporter
VALLLLAAMPVSEAGPSSLLWTAPCILIAAMLIAWAAESAQFFMAQGFALAILAWLQTLPEFAVEADIAWRGDVSNMTANFTGSLRLLVGLGWPMVFGVAALMERRRTGKWLREIVLDDEDSVGVVGLIVPIAYFALIWWKATLTLWDSLVLAAMYGVYLWILNRMPAGDEESIDELDLVPRTVMRLKPGVRGAAITGLFVVQLMYALVGFGALARLVMVQRPEVLPALPLVAVLLGWAFKMTFEPESPLIDPEHLYRRPVFLLVSIAVFALLVELALG